MTAQLSARMRVIRTSLFDLDLHLDLAPGERVAVMGPSGAGKSTLLAALAGFVRLDAGRIELDGDVIADASVRGGTARRGIHVAPMDRGVVLLGQEARLFPHLSARENVAFGPRARGHSRTESGHAADEWLDRVGLAGFGNRMPAQLSGGQQQRVAVARALAVEPRLVLLDEPLTALDIQTAAEIRMLLADQLRSTAVVITHDPVDALAIADRLVVIERGRVTQYGSVREVMGHPATPFARALSDHVRIAGCIGDDG